MDISGHWIEKLFATIDCMDAHAFAGFLTPNGRFCFGNQPALRGRAEIEQAVAGFFAILKRLKHRLRERWLVDDTAIITGVVTYERHDGKTLEAPFANVLGFGPDGIHDYRIYVDTSALFAE